MTGRLTLALGADAAFAAPLGVALHSALDRLGPGDPARVIVLSLGMDDIDRRRIEAVADSFAAELIWREVDDASVPTYRGGAHVSTATHLRLLLPTLAPAEVERVLYLDADVLVMDDLRAVWGCNLDGRAVAGVRDYLVPRLGSPGGVTDAVASNLDLRAPYVNAGVLLMDLVRWRDEAIGERAIEFLLTHEVAMADQEALNAVVAGDVALLDPRWNVQESLLYLDIWPDGPMKRSLASRRRRLLTDPGIIHFTGPSKPWHENCDHPARVSWARQLAASGWLSPSVPTRGGEESPPIAPPARSDGGSPGLAVTVAIPSVEPGELLSECLVGLTDEHLAEVVVVVPSAASVEGFLGAGEFDDLEPRFIPTEGVVGLVAVWRRAIESATGEFVILLAEDDVLETGFLEDAVSALRRNPSAAMAFGSVRFEEVGAPGTGVTVSPPMPTGFIPGRDMLRSVLENGSGGLHASAMLLRTRAVRDVGSYQADVAAPLLDIDLAIRLAERFDAIHLDRGGARMRMHPLREQRRLLDSVEGSEELAMCGLRVDAGLRLLAGTAASDPAEAAEIVDVIRTVETRRTQLIARLIPNLGTRWSERRASLGRRLAATIPKGERVLFLDEEMWGPELLGDCLALPFPSRNGVFAGLEESEQELLLELDRAPASYVAIPAESRWWLAHYPGLKNRLEATGRLVMEDDALVVYRLAASGHNGGAL